MNGSEITYMCNSFGISYRDLAKILNTYPYTVKRWIDNTMSPKGIHIEVLNSFHNILLKVKDKQKRLEIGIRLKLGIGAIIYMGLKDF